MMSPIKLKSGLGSIRSMGFSLAIIALFTCAWRPAMALSEIDDSRKTIAEIDHYLAGLVSQGDHPGLSVSIFAGGKKILERGYGNANLEWKTAVTPDTVFEIGSVSKSFIALSIAQLADAGLLSLDDPVSAYIQNCSQPFCKVKIRYLLNHTGGLGTFNNELMATGKSLNPELTRDDVLEVIGRETPLFDQGTNWSYSNSGAWVLSYIVEAASGETLADYLKEHVFDPFGMSDSRLNDYSAIIPRRAAGYLKADGLLENLQVHETPLAPFGAGGIVSTTVDMQKYLYNLYEGPLVSEAQRRIMYEQAPTPDGRKFAYTTGFLMKSSFYGHEKLYHEGEILGFSSRQAYYPKERLAIVILSNALGSAEDVSSVEINISKRLFRVKDTQRISGEAVEKNADAPGEYQLSEYRSTIDRFLLEEHEGSLTVRFSRLQGMTAAFPLEPLGMSVYSAKIGTNTLVLDFSAMSTDGDGLLVTLNGDLYKAHKIPPDSAGP